MDSRTPWRSLAAVGSAVGISLGRHLAVAFRAIARLKLRTLADGCEFVRAGSGADGEEWVRQFAVGDGVGIPHSSEAGDPMYRKPGFAEFGSVPIFRRMPG